MKIKDNRDIHHWRIIMDNMKRASELINSRARCQQCGATFADGTEFAEFIGWHGVCVECFMKAS